MKSQLFKFRSRAMADYYDGEIIVSAPTLVAARCKVLRHAKKAGLNLETVKEDLKGEPKIGDVFFIMGGS